MKTRRSFTREVLRASGKDEAEVDKWMMKLEGQSAGMHAWLDGVLVREDIVILCNMMRLTKEQQAALLDPIINKEREMN